MQGFLTISQNQIYSVIESVKTTPKENVSTGVLKITKNKKIKIFKM